MKILKHLSVAVTTAFLVATGGASAQSGETLSIATGGTGGVYYPIGGGFAEIIGKYLDGYSAVAEVTGASVENMALIHRGDASMALVLADTAYQAYHGQGQFEGRRKVENTRALASIYPNVIQIVLPSDSDIQSLQDLKGKRVSVGAPGSGTEVNSRAVLESNGITQDDFRAQRLNFNETADALRDGDIDAGLWSVGPPTSSIMSLAATRPIRILSLTEEERKNAIEREPVFASFTMPAGMYEGVDEPVDTLGIPNVLVVNADMPDDLAYELTKLLFEKKDELVAVHAAAENLSVDFTLGSTPVPLHPGAIRYFEEIGADVPAKLKP